MSTKQLGRKFPSQMTGLSEKTAIVRAVTRARDLALIFDLIELTYNDVKCFRGSNVHCGSCSHERIQYDVVFLACNHVTRRPCWGTKQEKIFSQHLHDKRVQFPAEENALFLSPSMAAMTSAANQQFPRSGKFKWQ